MTHRLALLVDSELASAVHALALLVERAYTPHMVLGGHDELRKILRAGLASGDDELVAQARATVSRLYAQRHVEFSHLLEGEPQVQGAHLIE